MIKPILLPLIITIFSGCSLHSYYENSILDDVKDKKTLILGTTGDYPPFSLKEDSGTFSGIDIDIAKELANDLGVQLKIYQTSWGTLSEDLEDSLFHIGLSGISRTESRLKIGFMTNGYMANGKMGISLCSTKNKFNSLSKIDHKNTQVIVNPGGTNQRFVLKNIKTAKVRVFDDNTKIFDEIIAGRADVMVTDLVEVLFQAKKHSEILCPTLKKPLTEGTITSFMPFDRKWNNHVRKWFKRFKKTNRFKEIIKNYL